MLTRSANLNNRFFFLHFFYLFRHALTLAVIANKSMNEISELDISERLLSFRRAASR